MKIVQRIRRGKNIQKILKSLGFLFSEKILRISLGFFVTAWVSRHLGPESYGSFVYITQYVLLFLPIVNFGMSEVISRDIVKEEFSIEEILGSSFFIKLVNSLLGITIIWVSLYIVEVTAKESMLIMALASILFIEILEVVGPWYAAHLEYKKLVVARNTGYFIGILAKLYFLFIQESFEYFILAYFIEIFFTKVIAFLLFVRFGRTKMWKLNFTLVKNYVLESIPLFFVLMFTIIEQKIGVIFMKSFQTPEVLGQFSLAFVVFNTLNFIPNALVTTLYPTIIRSRERSASLYEARLLKLSASLVWSAIGFAISFYLFGGELFLFIFGAKYTVAVEIMKFMSLISVFVFYEAARKKILVLENSSNSYFGLIVVFGIISILSQHFLVAAYSYKGIVMGTMIAYIVSNILVSMIDKKIQKTVMLFLMGFVYPLQFLKGIKKEG